MVALESTTTVIMVRSAKGAGLDQSASGPVATKGEEDVRSRCPHFHNDAGVAVIEIGSREFMCGFKSPVRSPACFLDLGNDSEIICPYCSTLYRYAADLAPGAARPPECVVTDKVV